MTRICIPLAFGTLLLVAAAQAQPIYKCTAPGGAVTMQQSPCSADSASSTTLMNSRPAPATARPAAGRAPAGEVAATASTPPPRRHWIVWTNNPRQDAVMATANLDVIRVLGQTCEARLRYRSKDLDECQQFLQHLAPGGDFGRIGDKINDLMRDPSQAQQVNRSDLRRAQLLAEDIGRIKEFVLAALNQR
jgi:hypothetical protein